MLSYAIKSGACGVVRCKIRHVVKRVPSMWDNAPDQYRGEHHGQEWIYEVWMVEEIELVTVDGHKREVPPVWTRELYQPQYFTRQRFELSGNVVRHMLPHLDYRQHSLSAPLTGWGV